MSSRVLLAILLGSVAFPAAAQQATATAGAQVTMPSDGSLPPAVRGNAKAVTVPVGTVTFPPTIEPAPKPTPMPATAKRAVNLARSSKDRPVMPRADADGYVRFAFGATQPTVVCAPGRLCVVSLEPGEVITGARDTKDVGHFTISDSVNWTVEPMLSGTSKTLVTQLSIRPSMPNLEATLVVPTQRRLYSITLRSTANTWMPLVAFDYPTDPAKSAAAYARALTATQPATGAASNTEIDFGFEMDGEAPWRPTAVYTDGARTIIVFPPSISASDMPVLVGLGNDGGWFSDPTQTVVNSQVLPAGRLLVDGVLSRAALVSGVGDDQVEVRITRRGS